MQIEPVDIPPWTKRCIFCGEEFTGQKKNFEHIIPQWLVKEACLAGRGMDLNLPNRTIKMGMTKIGIKVCKNCNDAGSHLESDAKFAYLSLKEGAELSDAEIRTLLDWLDKVRVGLWLWLIEHTKDSVGTQPKFRINQRVAAKDRLLLALRYPEGPPMKGLGIIGISDFFLGQPSVMGLQINNVSLTSISADFFVTRHIRDLKVNMTYTDGDFDLYNREGGFPQEPRMTVIGGPSVFAQCILPTEDFSEHGITRQAASAVHPGWSESPILRLNGQLREAPDKQTSVPCFSGNARASTVLMELNAASAASYILQDVERADKSKVDAAYAKAIVKEIEAARTEIDENVRLIKREYRDVTGLRLP